jgi:hypothetical protein
VTGAYRRQTEASSGDIQRHQPLGAGQRRFATGGAANPFNGWLPELQVVRADNSLLRRKPILEGIWPDHETRLRRFDSTDAPPRAKSISWRAMSPRRRRTLYQ